MRIVIDLQGAQTGSRFRGIGRYSISLAKALAQRSRGHELWVVANRGLSVTADELSELLDGTVPVRNIKLFSTASRVSWDGEGHAWRRECSELAREDFIRRLQPDAVLISSLFEGGMDDAVLSVGKLSADYSTTAILYDLIPLTEPEKYLRAPWAREWYFEKIADLRRASRMFAISDYTRGEAHRVLDVPEQSIVNISAACDDTFKRMSLTQVEISELRLRHGLSDEFIFWTGSMDERKNLRRLVEAYSSLPRPLIDKFQLALAGKWNEEEKSTIAQWAESSQVAGRVVALDHVSDADLVMLLNAAELFVFPSLEEGFGLPPLEAMACGTPTISSNATSLPEVIGLAEAMFDPTDIVQMQALMSRGLTDTEFREQLKKHALDQSSRFSWSTAADIVLDHLEALAATRVARDTSRPHAWPEVVEWNQEAQADLLRAIDQATTDVRRPSTDDLRDLAAALASNEETLRWAACQIHWDRPTAWRLEGPFDSSYSLALVNREAARAIDGSEFKVGLHSTEGPGDFDPNGQFLAANPYFDDLYQRDKSTSDSSYLVASRNLYPPRVADMQSPVNLLHCYAWEESGFPPSWIDDFNAHLQGVGCVSEHVRKLLIDNGLRVPVWVCGNGVNHWDRVKADTSFETPGEGFRFLHVSSCFPRKGADILLKAFGQAFTIDDDVCLVIKTFPNPHNKIHEWLEEAHKAQPNYPRVHIIEDDLADAQMKALYSACDCLVAPSKAEGFGLPLAEAMLCGLDVITTGWSGQLDFCSEATAWLVDYEFEAAGSHLGVFDSVWATPKVDDLASTMQKVHALPAEARGRKAQAAQRLLGQRFQWEHVGERMRAAATSILGGLAHREPKVGWISTWNTRCGIATYSSHLVQSMPSKVTVMAPYASEVTGADAANVIRCWDQFAHDDLMQLEHQLDEHRIDTIVIQFNYGFFDFGELRTFITSQVSVERRRVVIVLHSTLDPAGDSGAKALERLAPALRLCSRVVVHSVNDLNRLKRLGVVENTMLFPHGLLDHPAQVKERAKKKEFTLASYGFFLPNKGLPELVESLALLRQRGVNVKLKMINAEYPADISKSLISTVKAKINDMQLSGHVEMHTRFLPDEESLALLSECDLVVYPYQNTGESASGAVRYGITSGRPVAVTPLPIFDDISRAVFTLPGTTAQEIAKGLHGLIDDLMADVPSVHAKAADANQWIEAHRYSRLGRKFSDLLFALHNENRIPAFQTAPL